VAAAASSRDDPARARCARSGEQVVKTFGAQAVRFGELAVEMLEIGQAGESGHLVDHHLGFGACDRVADRRRVQPVHNHGLCRV
jgi:hypothetical protein